MHLTNAVTMITIEPHEHTMGSGEPITFATDLTPIKVQTVARWVVDTYRRVASEGTFQSPYVMAIKRARKELGVGLKQARAFADAALRAEGEWS